MSVRFFFKVLVMLMVVAGLAPQISKAQWNPPPSEMAIRNIYFENISNSATEGKADYKLNLELGASLSSGATISIFIMKDGSQCATSSCRATFSSSTYATTGDLKGNWTTTQNTTMGPFGVLTLTQTVGTGFYTFTISNVTNPKDSGDYKIIVAENYTGDQFPTKMISSFKFPIGSGNTPPGGDPGFNPPLPPGQDTSKAVNLTGVVKDSAGTPIKGASIDVKTENFGNFYFAMTDDNGLYEIRGMAPGSYKVSVYPPFDKGHLTAPDFVSVTLENETQLKTVNFTFTTSVKILNGSVKDDKGSPISQARIEGFQPGSGKFASVGSDSSGNYELPLGPGTWEVNISHAPPMAGGTTDGLMDWLYDGPSKSITFAENETSETQTVDWVVGKTSSTVKGQFVDASGTGVAGFVDLSSGVSSTRGLGQQTEDGTFSMGVNAGRYRVSFFPSDSSMSFYENKFEIAEGQTLDLGKISLDQKGSTIKGMVVDQNGNPVESVMVNAFTGGPGEEMGPEGKGPGGPKKFKHTKVRKPFGEKEKQFEGKFDDGFDLPKGCEPPGADQGQKTGEDQGKKEGRKFSVQGEDNDEFDKGFDKEKKFEDSPDMKGEPGQKDKPGMNQDGKRGEGKEMKKPDFEKGGEQNCPGEFAGEFKGEMRQFDFGNATTGSDGTFAISVNAGDYLVHIGMGPESNYVPTDPPVAVTVGEDETVENVKITVQTTNASINISVVDQNGEPYDEGFGFANCRKAGKKDFGPGTMFGNPLMNGRATVKVVAGSSYSCSAEFGKESSVSVDESKTAAPGENETASITLTVIPDDAVITGKIVDQYGKTVRQSVEVFAMSSQEDQFTFRGTRVESGGSYSISVRGGRSYVIGFFMPGFGPGQGGAQYVMRPPDHTPVSVPANGTAKYDIKLLKVEGYIKGQVTTPDGEAVKYSFVMADQHHLVDQGKLDGKDAIETGAPADEKGMYTIGVIAGEYQVNGGIDPNQSSSGYMPPKTQTVIVSKGKSATANLSFRVADATVSGSLKTSNDSDIMMGWCTGFTKDGNFSAAGVDDGSYSMNIVSESKEWTVQCNADVPGQGFYRSSRYVVSTPKEGKYTQDIVLEPAGFDLPEAVSTVIDSSSTNEVTLPDGSSIDIPAGSIADSGNLTIIATPTAELYSTEDKEALAFGWSLQALDENGQEIEEFNNSVNLNIAYEDEYLEAADITDETMLEGGYFDEDASVWKDTEAIAVDTDNQILTMSTTHFTTFATLVAGNSSAKRKTPKDGFVVVASQEGGSSQIKLIDEKGKIKKTWKSFGSQSGGDYEVVGGYFDGDNNRDYIVFNTASNAGASEFRAFTSQGKLIAKKSAYGSDFKGGITIITADLDSDTVDEVIVGPSANDKSEIRVYQYNAKKKKFALLTTIAALTATTVGGVDLAVGDIVGNGSFELIVSPTNENKDIRVYQYNAKKKKFTQLTSYNPLASTETQGSMISVGDVDNDGVDEIISTSKASFQIYGYQEKKKKMIGMAAQTVFVSTDARSKSGMNASVGNVDDDDSDEIVISSMAGSPTEVRTYDVSSKGKLTLQSSLKPFGTSDSRGAKIVLIDMTNGGNFDLAVTPFTDGKSQIRFYDLGELVKKQPKSLGSGYAFGKNHGYGTNISW